MTRGFMVDGLDAGVGNTIVVRSVMQSFYTFGIIDCMFESGRWQFS